MLVVDKINLLSWPDKKKTFYTSYSTIINAKISQKLRQKLVQKD